MVHCPLGIGVPSTPRRGSIRETFSRLLGRLASPKPAPLRVEPTHDCRGPFGGSIRLQGRLASPMPAPPRGRAGAGVPGRNRRASFKC